MMLTPHDIELLALYVGGTLFVVACIAVGAVLGIRAAYRRLTK